MFYFLTGSLASMWIRWLSLQKQNYLVKTEHISIQPSCYFLKVLLSLTFLQPNDNKWFGVKWLLAYFCHSSYFVQNTVRKNLIEHSYIILLFPFFPLLNSNDISKSIKYDCYENKQTVKLFIKMTKITFY